MEETMGGSSAKESRILQKRRSNNRHPLLSPPRPLSLFPTPVAKTSTHHNPQEYAANLIIPLSNILNAVEMDPISRSKAHCMQIIAEEKSYRFCASSEDALAEWLGALKSQLAKRKEKKGGTS